MYYFLYALLFNNLFVSIVIIIKQPSSYKCDIAFYINNSNSLLEKHASSIQKLLIIILYFSSFSSSSFSFNQSYIRYLHSLFISICLINYSFLSIPVILISRSFLSFLILSRISL